MREPAPERAELETGGRRFAWDTPEFARLANLSDAVFAIAMTLLVLNLGAPSVDDGQLAAALAAQLPQLAAFALSFLLVAQVWWQHHRILAALAWADPPMMALNFAVLAGVALVPYPTSLVGAAPTARAAVLPFIALFGMLTLLFLALIAWAGRTRAWRNPPPGDAFRRELTEWAAHIGVLALSLLVAVWAPLIGLAVLAVSSMALGVVLARTRTHSGSAWL